MNGFVLIKDEASGVRDLQSCSPRGGLPVRQCLDLPGLGHAASEPRPPVHLPDRSGRQMAL